jgi:hypothetical protein
MVVMARAVDIAHPRLTRASGRPIDMNGTCAAERLATAELGAGHASNIPQIPKKRHLRIAIKIVSPSVDGEAVHCCPTSFFE